MIHGISKRRTQKRGRHEITPDMTAATPTEIIRSPKVKAPRNKSTDTFDKKLDHYGHDNSCDTNYNDLPPELWLSILKHLNILDLINLSSVSRFFHELSNIQSLWQAQGETLGLSMQYPLVHLTFKQRVIQYVISQIKRVKSYFPEPLVSAVGAVRLAQVPQLQLKQIKDYLDFITPADVGAYPIRWGVDSASRPFLSFQLKHNRNQASSSSSSSSSSSTSEVPDAFPDVFVETLFKRHTKPSSSTWLSAGGYDFLKRAQDGNYTLHPNFLNYIVRLVRGEPCGKLIYNVFEQTLEEKTTTDDGKSIVELFPRKP